MPRIKITNVEDRQRTRRRILQQCDRIPPLPDVVLKLLELVSRGQAGPMEFEAILQLSPALAGKVLGLVNSPLFGFRHPITSIHDAVALLGYAPLRNVIMAYGTGELMRMEFSCYGHSEKGLWEHSVAVAAAARSLAKSCGLDQEDRELLFLAGLLHDVGKMLLAPYFTQHHVKTAHFPGDVHAMEKQFCGLDHTEAGALVTAKWNLPETLQEVIAHQHGGEGPADYRTHTAILRLAEAITHELGVGYLPGQVPEANYRKRDLAALGPVGEGSRWEEARKAMETAVDVALATMGQLLAEIA